MKFFEICAKGNNEADILLYGSIGEWGKVRAEEFINNLRAAEKKYSRINLRINSPGGSVFEGLAIRSHIKTSKSHIVAYVDGMAASMASVIVASCDEAYMAKGAKLMIHQGAGGVMGTASYIRTYASLLDSLNKSLAEIYAEKTGKEDKWILENWMADGKDSWFSGAEAKAAGLITDVVDGKVKPLKNETAYAFEEIAAHYETQISNNHKPDMKQIAAKLGLAEDATEEQILSAIDKIETKEDNTKGIKALVILGEKRGFKKETIEKLAKADFDVTLQMIEDAKETSGKEEKEGDDKKTKESQKDEVRMSDVLAELKASLGGGKEKKEEPVSLSKMKEEDLKALLKDKPEEYQKLFKAEYGYEPSLEELRRLAVQ